MSALWRQTASLHPTFEPLNRCLEQDWFLLPFELRLQRGHARALRAAGILSDAELAALESALGQITSEQGLATGTPSLTRRGQGEGRGSLETGVVASVGENPPVVPPAMGDAAFRSDSEDLHTWVESRLTALAGDAGRKIHTARSRNDQVATLLRMFCIDAAEQLAAQLAAFVKCACDRATGWAEFAFTLMTHQQFAAPGSVGFWMLRYAVALDRVRRRLLADAAEWRRECPLGSGAVAGSSIAIDRRVQARELGFDGPSVCALDSTTTRDDCLSLLATLTQLGLHLQAFAADIIIFSQTPLAWTIYPAAFGTGSSMMPNKRNPDAMELLRGEACSLAAAHGQIVLLLKGLPSGYNRDLQCVKPVVRDAMMQSQRLVEMLTAFVSELEFDSARLGAALEQGHVNATLRMEGFVRAGMPLRQAHHRVADEVTSADGGAEPILDAPLSRYVTTGSTNPDEVRRAAAQIAASLPTA